MDYLLEATVKLRIKNVEDEYEAAALGEAFFSEGLASLAYSDDEDDDHYEIEQVAFWPMEVAR